MLWRARGSLLSVLAALALSVVLHGLWLAVGSDVSGRRHEVQAPRIIQLEVIHEDFVRVIEKDEVSPVVRNTASTDGREQPGALQPAHRRPVRSPRAKTQSPHLDASSTRDAPLISAPTPARAERDVADNSLPSVGGTRPLASAARPLDLSPRMIALDADTRGASVGTGEQPPTEQSVRSVEQRVSAKLRGQLTSDAFVPSPFTPRSAPHLDRDRDGTCHYSGQTINATILADGGVQLNETTPALARRDGVAEPTKNPHTLEEGLAPQQVEVRLRYEPRGVEAEKDWFLRETKALRTELSDNAHKREIELAAASLREQLERSWCDVSRPLLDRKRAVVEMWSQLASDDAGFQARDIVLEFVNTHAPEDSTLAFTTQELETFNAGCAAASCFLPYAPTRRR